MTDTHDQQLEALRRLAAGVISGKIDPDTIPSGWDFLKIQRTAEKMRRPEIVRVMMDVSRKRLISKGYIELEGIGWKHKSDLPHLDLVKKHGRWYATDPRRTSHQPTKNGKG